MASFDRPRHGWEGISNGGEIYGNGNSRGGGSNELDDSFMSDVDPDRLKKFGSCTKVVV